ncbi:MAG: hypothetical protein EBR09_11035 [Proteobacteria bacterium]|nr:hypothetical protein [Pseudomonadota bacterium]
MTTRPQKTAALLLPLCLAFVAAGGFAQLTACRKRTLNETELRSKNSEHFFTARSILSTNPLEPLSKDEKLLGQLAQAAAKSSPDERAELSAKVTSMIGSDQARQRVLRTVFDAQEWNRYVTVCAKDGLPNVSGYTELSLLPEELRDGIIENVKQLYASAGKGDHAWKTTMVAPKRCLDAILSHAVNPLKMISRHEKIKTDPIAAYDSYLQVFRDIIFPDGSRGNYKAQQVADVAKIFQKFLQDEKSKRPIVSEYTIYMGGSYVNGRAKLESSDVDIITVDMAKNPVLAAHQMFSPLALTDAVRKRVRQDYPATQNVDLKVQIDNLFFNMSSGPAAEGPDIESKFSRFMPVMIAIRHNEIKLEVFNVFKEAPASLKPAFSAELPKL